MDQTSARKIRIILADDHLQVRKELAARLSRETDFEIVGVADGSLETLQQVERILPDVLLLDPMMRDGLGLATLRQISASLPDVAVVVLTAYVDTALNLELAKIGVKYVVTKGILSSHLLDVLHASVRA